jgi:hypothetical protein
MRPDLAPSPARGWAVSAVWAGAAWIVLAMMPVPLTTFLGLPFGLYALVTGWVAARQARARPDRRSARAARWGMGLGCAGFVYLTLFYMLAGAAILAGLAAAVVAALRELP